MSDEPRKMSDIMKEMLERVLRNPQAVPSSQAADVALLFANVAWNECVGIDHPRENYRHMWEPIEAEKPDLWNELKSSDIDAVVDELVEYKETHFPDDRRRIISWGRTPDGMIHIEWLQPAAPGVDVKWETTLYGLVRNGETKEAVRFLRQTRNMSQNQAESKVAKIRIQLGAF